MARVCPFNVDRNNWGSPRLRLPDNSVRPWFWEGTASAAPPARPPGFRRSSLQPDLMFNIFLKDVGGDPAQLGAYGIKECFQPLRARQPGGLGNSRVRQFVHG